MGNSQDLIPRPPWEWNPRRCLSQGTLPAEQLDSFPPMTRSMYAYGGLAFLVAADWGQFQWRPGDIDAFRRQGERLYDVFGLNAAHPLGVRQSFRFKTGPAVHTVNIVEDTAVDVARLVNVFADIATAADAASSSSCFVLTMHTEAGVIPTPFIYRDGKFLCLQLGASDTTGLPAPDGKWTLLEISAHKPDSDAPSSDEGERLNPLVAYVTSFRESVQARNITTTKIRITRALVFRERTQRAGGDHRSQGDAVAGTSATPSTTLVRDCSPETHAMVHPAPMATTVTLDTVPTAPAGTSEHVPLETMATSEHVPSETAVTLGDVPSETAVTLGDAPSETAVTLDDAPIETSSTLGDASLASCMSLDAGSSSVPVGNAYQAPLAESSERRSDRIVLPYRCYDPERCSICRNKHGTTPVTTSETPPDITPEPTLDVSPETTPRADPDTTPDITDVTAPLLTSGAGSTGETWQKPKKTSYQRMKEYCWTDTDQELIDFYRDHFDKSSSTFRWLGRRVDELEEATFSYADPKTLARQQAVRECIKTIMATLSEEDPVFAGAIIHTVGSFWDGTRVSKTANEFDLVVRLTCQGLEVQGDGAKMWLQVSGEAYRHWKSEPFVKMRLLNFCREYYVTADNFFSYFMSKITAIARKMTLPPGLTHGGLLAPMFRGLSGSWTAVTLSLVWEGDPLTVDLTPGFLIPLEKIDQGKREGLEKLAEKVKLSPARLPGVLLVPLTVGTLRRWSFAWHFPLSFTIGYHSNPYLTLDTKWIVTTTLWETAALSALGPESEPVKRLRGLKLIAREYLHWTPTPNMVQRAEEEVAALIHGLADGKRPDAADGVSLRGLDKVISRSLKEKKIVFPASRCNESRGVYSCRLAAVVYAVHQQHSHQGDEVESYAVIDVTLDDHQSEPSQRDNHLEAQCQDVSADNYQPPCLLCESLYQCASSFRLHALHPAMGEVLEPACAKAIGEDIKPWLTIRSAYLKFLVLGDLVSPASADGHTRHGSVSPASAEDDTRHGAVSPASAEGDTRHGAVSAASADGDTRHGAVSPASAEGDTRHGADSQDAHRRHGDAQRMERALLKNLSTMEGDLNDDAKITHVLLGDMVDYFRAVTKRPSSSEWSTSRTVQSEHAKLAKRIVDHYANNISDE